MFEPIHRRTLLVGLGAAASPFVLPRALAQSGATGNPFSLGVAAGEPWPDGFVLWTRLAPSPMAPDGRGGLAAPVKVRWEVFEDDALRRLAASGEVDADARFAHSLHVEVGGLRPNRPYWYRFTALGAQSPVGKAKTAPALGAPLDSLKVAVASCAHYEVGWFSAYRHMAAEQADLALFVGDYIYEYSYRPTRTDVVRRHDISTDALTLAEYRNRYALYKQDPDLQAVHHASASLVTWDDHELHNDYADTLSAYPGWTEETFRQRRIAAYQAFYEHMPLRSRSIPRGPALRLYDRYRFGNLAEFSFLDGRQYRSAQGCPTPTDKRGHVAPISCPDMSDPSRTYLGPEQEYWLYEGFKNAPAQWNIIAQQTQFSQYLQKGPGDVIGEYTDNWSAYGQSRQRLLDALVGSKLKNPVIFGGDIHCFVAADVTRVARDPESATVASEFVTTGITADPMPDSFADTLPMNPHVKSVDIRPRGYFTAQVTPKAMETRYRAISDRLDRNATVRTLKSFAIEAGRPGLIVR